MQILIAELCDSFEKFEASKSFYLYNELEAISYLEISSCKLYFLQVFESKFIEVDIVTRYICTANFQLSVLIWYFKMTFKLDLWKFLYSGLVYAMTNKFVVL